MKPSRSHLPAIVAVVASTALPSSALAAVTTYTQFSNPSTGWYQNLPSGAYYDPGTFSNWSQANSTSGTAGLGWEFFTVSVNGGTVTSSSGNLVFTANSTSTAMDVLFTFNFSGPNPPASPNGVVGFGINFSLLSPSANAVGVVVNSVPVASGSFPNGFIGVIATASGVPTLPISSARFTFQGGSEVTVTGTQYMIVPAPGAVALLAAASITRHRRRKC